MQNYHAQQVQFSVGQTVSHVTDEGQIVTGTVSNIDDDLLLIQFEDGEEGWEKASTCY